MSKLSLVGLGLMISIEGLERKKELDVDGIVGKVKEEVLTVKIRYASLKRGREILAAIEPL